jgi:hypothetical protein
MEAVTTHPCGSVTKEELVTAKQALMRIGVTKGVAAIGFTMTFLGFPEYGVGLVAVKCIGNSYLPKLGGIIQSKINFARPDDIVIIEDSVILKISTTKQHIPFEDYNILAPANVVIWDAH